MTPVAFLVIGLPHYREVFLDPVDAAEASARHLGRIEPLCLISRAMEDQAVMIDAAFEAGRRSRSTE